VVIGEARTGSGGHLNESWDDALGLTLRRSSLSGSRIAVGNVEVGQPRRSHSIRHGVARKKIRRSAEPFGKRRSRAMGQSVVRLKRSCVNYAAYAMRC
jgi:hypothetical protein